MDDGYILLSKANRPAALSSRGVCKAGYNCDAIRVRRAFSTLGGGESQK